MDGCNVGWIGAEDSGCEILAKRRFDGLNGLVGPGLDGNGLAPTLQAVFIGQPHHDRWAAPRLEELEFADQLVVHPADVDADDPAHLSRDPSAAAALTPFARLPS